MNIEFEKVKHEALANKHEALSRKYDKAGVSNATEILDTLNALQSAETLADVPRLPYHPHPLHGVYKGCFAVWVTKKYRVIFRPNHKGDPAFRIDNYRTITSIRVIEIFKDYHDK